MINRLLAASAITVASIGVGAGVASAARFAPCRSTIGELQTHTVVNVSPPCELDVFMWNGNLHGLSVGVRCAGMAGRALGSEVFQGQTYPVCYDVDY